MEHLNMIVIEDMGMLLLTKRVESFNKKNNFKLNFELKCKKNY